MYQRLNIVGFILSKVSLNVTCYSEGNWGPADVGNLPEAVQVSKVCGWSTHTSTSKDTAWSPCRVLVLSCAARGSIKYSGVRASLPMGSHLKLTPMRPRSIWEKNYGESWSQAKQVYTHLAFNQLCSQMLAHSIHRVLLSRPVILPSSRASMNRIFTTFLSCLLFSVKEQSNSHFIVIWGRCVPFLSIKTKKVLFVRGKQNGVCCSRS